MSLEERIRKLIEDIRRKPIPIKDIIPLLQEALDKIEYFNIGLRDNHKE